MVLAKVKTAQVSTGETTSDCSKVPVRFLPAWLHNPCVANLSRKVPSRGGTDPQGSQTTGILWSQSGFIHRGRQLLQLARTRDGRDKTHHPTPRGRISPTRTIPAIQHWTIIFELSLTCMQCIKKLNGKPTSEQLELPIDRWQHQSTFASPSIVCFICG